MPVGDHVYSTVTLEYTRDQLFSLRQPRVIDRAALTRIGHLGIQLRPPERGRRYRARGRRAGARVQRSITVVSRSYNSKPRDIIERKYNVNNLTSQPSPRRSANIVEPVTQRHTGCIELLLRCGTLNVRSINNKVVAVRDLLKDKNIKLLAVTEAWHEDAEASCIKRLRSEGRPVLEQARQIPHSKKTDDVKFINHGGVALVTRGGVRVSKIQPPASISKIITFELLVARSRRQPVRRTSSPRCIDLDLNRHSLCSLLSSQHSLRGYRRTQLP